MKTTKNIGKLEETLKIWKKLKRENISTAWNNTKNEKQIENITTTPKYGKYGLGDLCCSYCSSYSPKQ